MNSDRPDEIKVLFGGLCPRPPLSPPAMTEEFDAPGDSLSAIGSAHL